MARRVIPCWRKIHMRRSLTHLDLQRQPFRGKLPPFYVRSIEGNLKADLDALIKRGLKATLNHR